jgi:MFS superfamily sulfate permease-like transporter
MSISQEGIAVGRSLALIKNEQIDGNKEMIAFGIMNIAGSFTSCYLTTGDWIWTLLLLLPQHAILIFPGFWLTKY